MKFRILQILIAFDQFLNALLFGGWADETMSSAAWRMEYEGYFWGKVMRPVIDTIMFFDPHHCEASYQSERLRLQLPPEERT